LIVDSRNTVVLAIGLIIYTGYRAIRSRKLSFVAWLFANAMLFFKGITGRSEFTWIFIGTIALTIIFQWYENRPMTSKRFLRQLQAEAKREARRKPEHRDPS